MWNLFVLACHLSQSARYRRAPAPSHMAACIIHRPKGHACLYLVRYYTLMEKLRQVEELSLGLRLRLPLPPHASRHPWTSCSDFHTNLRALVGWWSHFSAPASSPQVGFRRRGRSLLAFCRHHTSLSKCDISTAPGLAGAAEAAP